MVEAEYAEEPDIKYLVAGLLSAIIFICYYPALWNDFVDWDDPDYVLSNPHIHSLSLSFLKWAFSSFYASNWHPLTWISHALDYAVWGLESHGAPPDEQYSPCDKYFSGGAACGEVDGDLEDPDFPSPQCKGRKGEGKGENRGIPRYRSAHNSRDNRSSFRPAPHACRVGGVGFRKEEDLLCALFYLLSMMAVMQAYVRSGSSVAAQRRTTHIRSPLHRKIPVQSRADKYGPGFR